MSKLDEFINKIICGDAYETLRQMPSGVVNLFMFSPPYWSLRDYKVNGQIGLEKDFNEYLVKMWLIFDELWRVLRKDGTLWVNLGDGYSSKPTGTLSGAFANRPSKQACFEEREHRKKAGIDLTKLIPEKSLLMLPERLALGLINRGWILRNKIIWCKPNPMPCSAKDRFTTTWEYLYFFVKSKKYWFDLDAVRRPQLMTRPIGKDHQPANRRNEDLGIKDWQREERYYNPAGKNPGDVITTKIPQEDAEKMGSPRARQHRIKSAHTKGDNPRDYDRFKLEGFGGVPTHPAGANPGDFWSIPTQPSSLPHYASYPEKLCETPLKAGCPRWICKECGKAKVRVTKTNKSTRKGQVASGWRESSKRSNPAESVTCGTAEHHSLGWTFCSCLCPACGEADCKCGKKWRAGIVLDPFVGIGTTCIVAKTLGLDYIGIDIKKGYCDHAIRRLKDVHYQEMLL